MKGSLKPQYSIPFIQPWGKAWAAAISLIFYFIWFPYLLATLGRAGIAFYTLPAILIGFLLGRKWGLAAGILFGPVHALLFAWQGVPILPTAEEIYATYIFISLYLISVLGAYLVGYLQETRLHYQQALKNRQQIAAALRESEKRYRHLLNHTSNIIVLIDQHGQIEYVTPSAEVLSGYTPKELAGKHFGELIHPEWQDKVNFFYARQIKTKTPKTYTEFPIIGKDERVVWVANVVELLIDQGQVSGGQGVLIDITQRIDAQQAMQRSEERFRSITEQSSDITMIVDADRIIQYISPSIINITNFSPDMIVHQSFDQFVHPDHQEEMIVLFEKSQDSPPGTVLKSGPVMGLHRDGRWLYFESTLTNMLHVKSVSGIVVNVREITQQVEMEKELWQSEYSFRTLFNQANDAVVIITLEGSIVEANARAAELFGFTPQSLTGKQIRNLLDDMEIMRFDQALNRLREENHIPITEWDFKKHNQTSIPVEINFGVIYNNLRQPVRIICTIRDISQRKKTEDILRHLATHDPLTKLPNRELFFSRFETACNHADEGHYSVAVAFIDLNNFKRINDEYGHAAGDEVLKQVSARLKSSVRQHDTLARMSGDEFTLLLEGVEQTKDIEKVIQKINQRMEVPFSVAGESIKVGASIGISVYPQDSKEPEKIIHFADAAMYEAKNHNHPYFFYQNPA